MRKLLLYLILLIVLGVVAGVSFHGLLPDGESRVMAAPLGYYLGEGESPTGLITTNVACNLSFDTAKRLVVGDNHTGKVVYIAINTDTVSATFGEYLIALDNGEDLKLDEWRIEQLTILVSQSPYTSYTAITDGISFKGWP